MFSKDIVRIQVFFKHLNLAYDGFSSTLCCLVYSIYSVDTSSVLFCFLFFSLNSPPCYQVCNNIQRGIKTDSISIVPVKSYSNADIQKQEIIKDNKDKIGIYRWTNILTRDFYIGSSKNLSQRFSQYYSYSNLISTKSKNMIIHKALLKYGYSNFSIEILEY